MKKFILLLPVCFSSIVSAQETPDLRKCIDLALKNNFALEITRNNAQIAENDVTLANAGYLPAVTAEARYSGSINNNVQTTYGGDKTTKNGVNNTAVDVGPALSWNIFQGFRVRATYDRLKELRSMGELSVKLQTEALIVDVAAEYYNLLSGKNRHANLKYALSISSERLRLARTQFELGSRSKLDVLQAEVDFNADSSNLLMQQQSILQSETRLKRLMGFEPTERMTIVDSIIPINDNLNYDSLHENMIQDNITLQTLIRLKNISELDLKLIKSRSLPYLRFNTGFGYVQNRYGTGDGPASVKINENTGMNYGLTLGINLMDGFNSQRNKKNAELDIRNRELDYKDAELYNKTELYNVFNSYRNNLNLLRMETHNFATAEENYETSMERFKLGVLSGIELREAQINLQNAQERLLQAKYLTKIDEIRLIRLSGNIMNYF